VLNTTWKLKKLGTKNMLLEELGVVVHTCGLSYLEDRNRRFVGQGQPKQMLVRSYVKK
jgi:hypothetical protein